MVMLQLKTYTIFPLLVGGRPRELKGLHTCTQVIVRRGVHRMVHLMLIVHCFGCIFLLKLLVCSSLGKR